MKRIILLSISFLVMGWLSAQTKITKTSVIGKWILAEVEMGGIFYYNNDRDSFALGEVARSQVKDESQQAAVIAMIKPQLAMFTKMSFEFKADNSAILNAGIQEAENAMYTVDPENSTITTSGKDGKTATMKAGMLSDKLRVTLAPCLHLKLTP